MTSRSTATAHRVLQKDTARRDEKRPPLKAEKAVQTGVRRYPEPPFSKQHQAKPGEETRLCGVERRLGCQPQASLEKRNNAARTGVSGPWIHLSSGTNPFPAPMNAPAPLPIACWGIC